MTFQQNPSPGPGTDSRPDIFIDGYNLAHIMGWLPLFDQETLALARETLLIEHPRGAAQDRDSSLFCHRP